MLSADLNKTLFYRYRGFDRERFQKSADLARQRLDQLRKESKTDADLDFDRRSQQQQQFDQDQDEKMPLVSRNMSLSRSGRVVQNRTQFTQSLPKYAPNHPNDLIPDQTPIDLYV